MQNSALKGQGRANSSDQDANLYFKPKESSIPAKSPGRRSSAASRLSANQRSIRASPKVTVLSKEGVMPIIP
eukprot:CAMPEP_0185576010 /NCGR_PEP_ID=MMETSP0434-20130131/7041_1 /TAXON_ID=626734 ORGANISM="Favella taraikaensis, Strain Fe Narragansett Bay" /NCGR_SAMPLE_ID=MMETSP0434 /ASSEMBLY_ACC=CAM_ASM_000379 /LENGTH=71 /DNA_ID=CAMNT_0028193057 /DNA_START=520 /DNA_END=735 /DNA_ORIENTATION=+